MMADDDIVRVDLGDSGRAFFRQQFATFGFRKLIALAKKRENEIEETFAFLPRRFARHAAAAENYKWGIGMPIDYESILPPIVQFVHEFLDESTERICVMDNADARKEYPYVAALETRVFFDASDVYHIVLPGDARERIYSAFCECKSIPYFFAILTQPNDYFAAHPEGRVELHLLDVLVRNAEFFVTTAWDGEGYVVARLGAPL